MEKMEKIEKIEKINDIELEVFKTHTQLKWFNYLQMGYRQYRTWLGMILGYQYMPSINFCVARSLNAIGTNNSSIPSFCMGMDLEINYLIAKCLRDLSSGSVTLEKIVKTTLKDILYLSEGSINQIWEDYSTKNHYQNLALSNEEFNILLSQAMHAHPDIIEIHSQRTWRSNNMNNNSVIIYKQDILFGNCIQVQTSKHLGIQLLTFKGYIKYPNAYYPTDSRLTFINMTA